MKRLCAIALALAGCVDTSSPVFANLYDPQATVPLPVTITTAPGAAGSVTVTVALTTAVTPPPSDFKLLAGPCAGTQQPVSAAATATGGTWSFIDGGPIAPGACRGYRVRAVSAGGAESAASDEADYHAPACPAGESANGCSGCGSLCLDGTSVCSNGGCAPCTLGAQCGAGYGCDTSVSPALCSKSCQHDADCGAGHYCSAQSVCASCSSSDALHCGGAGTPAGCVQCPATFDCSSAACACPPLTAACGQACADTVVDHDNCSGCGKPCLDSQFCLNGSCTDNAGISSLPDFPIPSSSSDEQLLHPPSYTATADTVLDNVTHLLWQRVPPAAGFSAFYTGNGGDAYTYCQNLSLAGLAGWRAPTLIEQISILDYGKSPTLDAATFTSGASQDAFWTSAPVASSSCTQQEAVMVVLMSDGSFSGTCQSFSPTPTVRCVRYQ